MGVSGSFNTEIIGKRRNFLFLIKDFSGLEETVG